MVNSISMFSLTTKFYLKISITLLIPKTVLIVHTLEELENLVLEVLDYFESKKSNGNRFYNVTNLHYFPWFAQCV